MDLQEMGKPVLNDSHIKKWYKMAAPKPGAIRTSYSGIHDFESPLYFIMRKEWKGGGFSGSFQEKDV